MELRHLRYFVAVAEELNFRKAAESLRITRPALSKQIKDLEDEIDVKLLDRDTVSVSLTKAGEVFLSDAQTMLKLADKAIERATEAQAGRIGKLRIASVGVIATDFLPATLQIFNKRYPGVEVSFVEMHPEEQMDALENGTIDVGFAYGTDPLGRAEMNLLCLITSHFGIAMSKHHPWATRDSVNLSETTDNTILCLGNGSRSHRDEVHRFMIEEGQPPPRIRSIEGFDSFITMVAADQGISMLPVVLDLTTQGIVILPFTSKNIFEFKMWAVWKKDSTSEMVTHFIKLLEERI
jgi:DNA-binding transcriptional LysR family regulator